MGRPSPAEPVEPVEPVDPFVNAACSFCGKHRREVRKLVAGPSVYICDECLVLSAQILDEECRAQEGHSYYVDVLLASVAALGARAPHAVATPILHAVIALAAGAPAVLRRVLAAASQIDDLATALAAISAISVDQRSMVDRLNHAAMLSNAGRWSAALAELDTIEAGALDGGDLMLHRLHGAFAELQLGELARPRMAVHRATALELAPAVTALPAGWFEDALRAERLAVLTLANLALGDHDDAEAAARERVALQPDNPTAHEVLAHVLTTRGDRDGGEAALAAARERAHPDGVVARRLANTGQPFR